MEAPADPASNSYESSEAAWDSVKADVSLATQEGTETRIQSEEPYQLSFSRAPQEPINSVQEARRESVQISAVENRDGSPTDPVEKAAEEFSDSVAEPKRREHEKEKDPKDASSGPQVAFLCGGLFAALAC